ncbi:MAG: hypothetical protein A3F67_03285 [Verrucomicrobia bacterium RIFCSPHIGHO2_12_FULL_41_10]|nr:MAG: hypothetical protein A3F67_03285 [Verrucomicrobia bacterium RIFCSPHIGHO2_12_FULL_41_10]HLB34831.1 ABC transporter ATP-binding protein [Chthoniobacterales bacterium]
MLAISVKNVSKAYTIWRDPAARLKHPLLKLAGEMFPLLRERIDKKLEGLCREFYALKDISFEVKKGESIGIIGRNGSGKSTLLQIIAGTLQPSEGSVTVNGRVAALLELGSGFNPEFTGRENVYLNASILGLTRNETEERFPKIEAFADIGEFIDQPVKTYSSGMMVRLAFAVVSHIDADILIIDEALAVGDYFFQQKCTGRIRKLQENGTTLLFVSHDLGSVRNLCEKALYLKKGTAFYWGASEKTINYYFNEQEKPPGLLVEKHHALVPPVSSSSHHYLNKLRSEAVWWLELTEALKNEKGSIVGVIICNEKGVIGGKINIGEKIKIKIVFLSLADQNYHVVVEFKNRYNQIINSTSTYTCGIGHINMGPNDIAEYEFYFDLNIEAGKYSYQIILAGENSLPNRCERLHETSWLGPLDIEWDYENKKAPFLGMFGLPAIAKEVKKWRYE